MRSKSWPIYCNKWSRQLLSKLAVRTAVIRKQLYAVNCWGCMVGGACVALLEVQGAGSGASGNSRNLRSHQ